ncbi:MAG: thiamine-phosphate pyrophosphorylase [Planctomycetota bacterium]
MKRLPPKLLALSPGDLKEGQDLGPFLARCDSAIASGLEAVLLREHQLSDGSMYALALALRERLDALPNECGWLGVHDRVHVALASKADGIHLGFRSLSPQQTKPLTGDAMVIGLSTHAHDRVEAWTHADYLFHGPFKPTSSKAGILDSIGLNGLESACSKTDRPIWALGGVGIEDVDSILKTGVNGVAVLSGILGQSDPSVATTRYLAGWGQA